MADSQKIKQLLESKNLAEGMDEDKLKEIGKDAKAGFEQDLASRDEWERKMEEWIDLAKQVTDQKSYPWRNASNVKYPLLSTAAMQFAARAYPTLVPSDRQVVEARPIGKDPDGSKTKIADAVSIYMSYQLLEEMDGWEEDMDKMLLMLPIVGVMFKKTYWDSVKKKNCSRLVLPKNLVVDYWTRCLEEAERISEIVQLSKRKVQERKNAGIWLDVELGEPPTPLEHSAPPHTDATTPYTFVEQHTYLDLDDDDYPEPYIVTFQRETGKVVRIAARFDHDTITMSDDGKDVVSIEPVQYYTKFGFIPSADGGFYDEGFGTLLGPLNESVNTLINQLIDAGHLSSLQAGFLGKGLRLRMGETQFKPGEWKVVNATGDDLKKQIVPLPTKEPSKVLFELMGSLITSGKELASVAEIFVGKMPGQNTPATTTMASIDQGMKVFTAVYKRVYRALAEEFQKLYRLNHIYLNPTVVEELSIELDANVFAPDNHKIYPGADPSALSSQEKLQKAEALLQLLPIGVLDPIEVVKRVLDAQEQPNATKLFNQQIQQTGQMQPPPDPKLQEIQMKSQAEQAKAQAAIQATQQKAALDTQSQQAQLQMKAQEHQMEMQHKATSAALDLQIQQHRDNARVAQEAQQQNMALVQQHQQHIQQQRHAEETHQAQLSAAKQMAKAKPAATKGPTKK